MTDAQLFREFSSLPDDLKKEVADFVAFLKTKLSGKKTSEKSKRPLGLAKGQVFMTKDFDEPLSDFKEYM